MHLRNIANQVLVSEFPHIHNDIAIDKSVYATGLRMSWCHKGMMGSRTAKKMESLLEDHEKIFPGRKYIEAYALVDPGSFESLVPKLEHLKWTILENKDLRPGAVTPVRHVYVTTMFRCDACGAVWRVKLPSYRILLEGAMLWLEVQRLEVGENTDTEVDKLDDKSFPQRLAGAWTLYFVAA
ncbi:hypothetical protein BDK51DRAFT_32081 [Blyttiomyces helicus]|uniref:Uncharacterized protein n=1 Tax=Blyttiomyces helicus TaxID=388810 RepID=A0A4P9WTB7_9FUNG|nr:hypothetical protein BDK51DRAFT_32081 [Blyttiomyces helicus]|eukprot:RKO94590.1 hypothetical protein BDK51DRAFT_32081 [Blyttiomyces helicus]